MATIEDFEKVDIRVGKIVSAEDFPEARKLAYKLRIDFGDPPAGGLGIKTSSAQITNLYTKEELIGKLVVCVTNFPSRKIGPFLSEVLICGFWREDGAVVLAVPDKDAPLGAKLG